MTAIRPSDLTRSIEVTAEGRTLVGLAFRWDHPSTVQDPGTAPYLEEFARGATSKTLAERSQPFPLLRHHQLSKTVGAVAFSPSAEGLVFAAEVARTRDGDEALELVNIGAERSVSVRFTPFKSRTRVSPDGPVITRTEIGLRELSLAPTGFGLHQGAEVVAVRAEVDVDAARVARRRRLLLLDLDLLLADA